MGFQKFGTCIIAHCFGQLLWIIFVGICTNCSRKKFGNISCCFMDSGHDDVTWHFSGELLNALSQVRFDQLDPSSLEKSAHFTFFLQHRFTFYDFSRMVTF
ncbi:hypothetical protein D3C81_1669380 [compost metagenome]